MTLSFNNSTIFIKILLSKCLKFISKIKQSLAYSAYCKCKRVFLLYINKESRQMCVFSRDAILINKFRRNARLRYLRRAPISSRLLFNARVLRLLLESTPFYRAYKGEDKEYCIYFTEFWLSLWPRHGRIAVPRSSALPNDNYYSVMIVTRDAVELNPFSPYADVPLLRF